MDRSTLDRRYLGLPTAAAEVHIALFGVPPDALSPLVMRAALEGMARALAPFIRICTLSDASNVPVEIPALEIAGGMFTRGAHAFVSKAGKEYRSLVVQRSEMTAAVPLLRKAALRRALEVIGSEELLSSALQIELPELEAYLAGRKSLPPRLFGEALDIAAKKRR